MEGEDRLKKAEVLFLLYIMGEQVLSVSNKLSELSLLLRSLGRKVLPQNESLSLENMPDFDLLQLLREEVLESCSSWEERLGLPIIGLKGSSSGSNKLEDMGMLITIKLFLLRTTGELHISTLCLNDLGSATGGICCGLD